METPANLIQMQINYITQAYIKSHATRARKEKLNPTQSLLEFSSDLSMVTKVEGRVDLSNPYFCIEECIEQLYEFW